MTSRQEESLKTAEELLSDIELGRTGPLQALLKASRLARLLGDDAAREWIEYEIEGYPHTESARIQMSKLGRVYVDQQTKQEATYSAPLAALIATQEAQKAWIAATQIGSISGDNIVIALRERQKGAAAASNIVARVGAIIANVTAEIHAFASRAYHELVFSAAQASFFEVARAQVDSRLAHLSGSALLKIESISDRFRAGDPEAVSAAMNTSRRLIDAVADALFVARNDPYAIGEQELRVDQASVVNRLNAYVHSKGIGSRRRDRIRRELSDLYASTSKGVHSDISIDEARFVFLQTYIVLGEIVTI